MSKLSRLLVAALLGTVVGCGDPTTTEPIDLSAEWLTFDGPGTVEPGDDIPVRVQSYVTGEAASWPVRLYLSADTEIGASDIRVADAEATPGVPDGRGTVTEVPARVPIGTAAGLYYLGVILDPDAELPDTNRSDNFVISTLVIGIGVPASDVAGAPTPLAPEDRALFETFPRLIPLDWSDVAGAVSYDVEVDLCSPGIEPDWWNTSTGWFVWEERIVGTSGWTTEFAGAQPGRWRVRGLDARGVSGPASAWQFFRSLV